MVYFEFCSPLCICIFTARKLSLGQGNVFRSVCQSFCPQGGWGVLCMMSLTVWLPGPMFLLGGLYPWSHVPGGGLCPGGVSVQIQPPWIRKAGGTHPTGMLSSHLFSLERDPKIMCLKWIMNNHNYLVIIIYFEIEVIPSRFLFHTIKLVSNLSQTQTLCPLLLHSAYNTLIDWVISLF